MQRSEPRGGVVVRRLRASGMRRQGQGCGDGPLGLLALLPRCGGLILQPALHTAEPLHVEQPAQQLLALGGIGVQHLRKAALRQHHDLPELLALHADQIAQFVARLLRPAGEWLFGAVGEDLADEDLVAVLGRPFAAEFGALLLR